MLEIEKLYKNAGIEKEFEKPAECAKNPYITCDGCMLFDNIKGKCNNKKDYPPFTAEKQLKIIKLLSQQCDLAISHFREWEFIHFDGQESTHITGKDFTETLANYINSLWQDLTEQEKAKIKEILK